MKTTFITTVFNEEKTIHSLLQSLQNQTQLPSEIIICDAYSTDSTLSLLHNFAKKHTNVLILQKKGNRAIGRNYAIKHAKNDIILCSDAGCTLDKKWIEEITRPFLNRSTDVVAGYYYPVAHNTFQKLLATYTCVMPDQLNPGSFLPSSRSVAFRKQVWIKVGGYPEYLDTCEDLVFANEIKKRKFHMIFVKNAFVYWPQRENIFAAAKQFYSYAKGDGRALYIRTQVPLLYIRYAVMITLLGISLITRNRIMIGALIGIGILYCMWAIAKKYRYNKSIQAIYLLPVIQFIADGSVLCGTTVGLMERLMRR